MILGLLKPTSGEVLINGLKIEENPIEILQKINFISPYIELPKKLTVKQNLIVYGKLYSVKIANSNNAAVYVKLFNAYGASVGSTPPDWVFSCPASETYTYEIPGGVSYDALTVCATENGNPNDNTTPSVSVNEKIAVTIVTSV